MENRGCWLVAAFAAAWELPLCLLMVSLLLLARVLVVFPFGYDLAPNHENGDEGYGTSLAMLGTIITGSGGLLALTSLEDQDKWLRSNLTFLAIAGSMLLAMLALSRARCDKHPKTHALTGRSLVFHRICFALGILLTLGFSVAAALEVLPTQAPQLIPLAPLKANLTKWEFSDEELNIEKDKPCIDLEFEMLAKDFPETHFPKLIAFEVQLGKDYVGKLELCSAVGYVLQEEKRVETKPWPMVPAKQKSPEKGNIIWPEIPDARTAVLQLKFKVSSSNTNLMDQLQLDFKKEPKSVATVKALKITPKE